MIVGLRMTGYAPRIVILTIAGLILLSCNQAGPYPRGGGEILEKQEATPVPKAAWQQRWEAVLAEGKKEGSVALYSMWSPAVRTAIIKALEDRYGIKVENSPFMRGAEITAKIQTEQRAGLYLADVIGVGATTALGALKPAGVLGPTEPFLVLPEVTDPKVWIDGKFPFVDKDKLLVGMMLGKQTTLMYNTELIKEGELTSYKDVLKPQYKGKITLSDPTVAGVGSAFMGFLAYNLWNVDEAKEFLRRLIKEQDVVIQRDNRLHVESVARGKFAIGLANANPQLEEFLRLGAPLAVVSIKEGTQISHGGGALSIPKRVAHPNATAVFVNWMLSKEGQTVYSKAFGTPSMRTDVPTESLLPAFLPKPGEKLIMESEEASMRNPEFQRIAHQIIEEAGK